MNSKYKINNKGFVATGVLYSLIAIIAVILFLIVRNNFTTGSTIDEDAGNIKEQLSKYTIFYDPNGGIGSMEHSSFVTGETNKLKKNTFTRANHVFLGWGLSSLVGEAFVQDEGQVNNYDTGNTSITKLPVVSGQSITLYAIWRPKDTTVPTMSFVANKVTSGTEVSSGNWSDEGLTFTLTEAIVGASGATIYYCQDTSNSCTPTTSVESGTKLTQYSNLTGTYYIRFQIISGDGKTSGISSYQALVDTSTPSMSFSANKVTSGTVVNGGTWSDEGLTFTFTKTSSGASGATIYYCKDTNNTCVPSMIATSGTKVTTYSSTNGIYYIRSQIVGNNGKKSSIIAYKAQVDTNTPTVSIKANKVTSGTEVTADTWSDEGLKFTFTSNNVGGSGATIYYCKDTSNTCNPTTSIADKTELTSYTSTIDVYYIRYKIVSTVNKSSSVSSYKAKVDNVTPKITMKSGTYYTDDETLVYTVEYGPSGGDTKCLNHSAWYWQAYSYATVGTMGPSHVVCEATSNAGKSAWTEADFIINGRFKPGAGLSATNDAYIEGDKIILPANGFYGGVQYGPYYSAHPGCYSVKYTGENLNGSVTRDSNPSVKGFEVYSQMGNVPYEILDLNAGENTATYRFYIAEFALDDLETRLQSNDDERMAVSQVEINYVGTSCS